MRPLPSAGRRVAAVVVAVLLITLARSDPARGQQPGPRPATPEAIDVAIEKGVRYLLQSQNPEGHWGKGTGPGSDKGWASGYTSLAAIALIECGVPANDPAVKKAAGVVRLMAPDLDSTYEVALAILLFDRIGEKKDRATIQSLAARLIAGQTMTGGWGYKVPKLGAGDARQLLTALQRMNPPPPPPVPSVRERPPGLGLCIKMSDETRAAPPARFDAAKARSSVLASLPAGMKQWSVFQPMERFAPADPEKRTGEPFAATTDNSNTHFATLAVWAARKHDVPVDQTLQLIAQRFRTSQGADGTWGYAYARNGGGGSPALTCVALLGLAIGHVVSPDAAVRPEQDPQVVNAFSWLSKRVAAPAGDTTNRPHMKDVGGLYFMWAMERVAVIYDVAKLDKKDWYLWGAEILLCHQKGEGDWTDGAGSLVENPVLSTSMALLFLKRANLTPDLSRRFTVDTTALTTKVEQTAAPKTEPMMPEKPPVTPPVTPPTETQPEPPPMPKDTSTPPVTPPVTPPTFNQPMPAPQGADGAPTTTSKPESGSAWPWVLGIVALLALLGAGAFFAMKKAREKREAAAKAKKKKKKAKPKVVEEEE